MPIFVAWGLRTLMLIATLSPATHVQELDKEMGDLDERADVVDEKMWGEDESDDEINEKEKEEQGSSKTNQNEESEIVAKQVCACACACAHARM